VINNLKRFIRTLPVKMVVVTLAVIVIMSACSDKATERFRDGPRSDIVNDDPADIIEFPDGFSNLATKCDHGNRVYTAFKADNNRAAITVSPRDPSCPQIGTALTIKPDGTVTEE
jgi:hypothetical protein